MSDHKPAKVLIGMGGNLGDVPLTFERAKLLLSSDLFDIQLSPLYKTPPVFDKPDAIHQDVPDYTNAVMMAKTWWEPHDLLQRLLKVEKVLGRQRPAPSCSPRTIDLDLLLYNHEIIQPDDKSDLQIPHPRMHVRSFVLIPACDLAPDWIHPVLNQTLRELKDHLSF